jgi:hypothetical protein
MRAFGRIATLAGLMIVALVALGTWHYRRTHPPPPPPPTAAELQALQSRRDALQVRLRAAIVSSGEKGLARAPRAGIMIGVPTGLTRSIAEQFVGGLFREMTLTLENIKVHHKGAVKAKMLFRKKQIGAFELDVHIEEMVGVLRPGKPELRFSEKRLVFVLPVSLASGSGRARLRFRWDSKGLAANAVCGDIDVTELVTGSVVPADYRLDGAFAITTQGDALTLSPDFADLAVRIAVAPTEQAWRVVDEVVDAQRAGCELALDKVNIKEKLAAIVGRGFNVKMPKKLHKPFRLPAGIKQSLDVQGLRLAVQVKPTALLISEERLWYGADLALRRAPEDGGKDAAAGQPGGEAEGFR